MNIADDRTGFDLLSAQTVGHYGLMMRRLEKTLPGELKVDIPPGQGTQPNFRIPLVNLQTRDKGDQTLPIYPSTPMTCHFGRD